MDTTTVLITLICYKALLLAIGLWAQRRTHSTEDFFLGGRGLGPVVAAVSYSASAASAWTLLGVSGVTYVIGISALWIVAGAVLGCAIAWLWIAPRLRRYSRRHRLLTLTEFLAHRSEPRAARRIIVFASLVIVTSFIFYVAAQFQGAGNAFVASFAIGLTEAVVLGGVIIMAYTLLGGFWAVSVTDTLQGLLMAAAAVVLPITAWFAIGGWAGFVDGLAAVATPEQLALTGGNAGLLALGVIAGNMAIGIGTFGQPHLLARFMALRDEKAMRKAQIIAIGWYALVFCGMFFLGLAGRILIPAIDNPENIFFELTATLFPPLLGAILLAAVLSAIMSTADSMLLVAAASVSHDLGYGRRFRGRELLISRLVIALLCLIAAVVAVALPASIFQRVLFAWIAIGSAFGPLVFARLAGMAVAPRAAMASMVCGFGLALLFYLLPDTPGDVLERLVPFISAMLVLLLYKQLLYKQRETKP